MPSAHDNDTRYLATASNAKNKMLQGRYAPWLHCRNASLESATNPISRVTALPVISRPCVPELLAFYDQHIYIYYDQHIYIYIFI